MLLLMLIYASELCPCAVLNLVKSFHIEKANNWNWLIKANLLSNDYEYKYKQCGVFVIHASDWNNILTARQFISHVKRTSFMSLDSDFYHVLVYWMPWFPLKFLIYTFKDFMIIFPSNIKMYFNSMIKIFFKMPLHRYKRDQREWGLNTFHTNTMYALSHYV